MPEGSKINTKQIAMIAVAAVALGAGAWLIARSTLGGDDLKALTDKRTMIDAVTGETFVDMRLPDGAPIPYTNPKTGGANLYPAEMCFWNADGTARLEPSYVLLNEFKSETGPTICPDCGRRVVAHNPLPPDNLLVDAAEAAGG